MTFQESIKTCFSKYADFNGRAVRSEYWWFALFIVLVSMGLGIISEIVSGLFSLAVLIPSIAAAARRLHDTNRSGWWQLIAFIPFIGWIIIITFLAQEGNSDTNQYGANDGYPKP